MSSAPEQHFLAPIFVFGRDLSPLPFCVWRCYPGYFDSSVIWNWLQTAAKVLVTGKLNPWPWYLCFGPFDPVFRWTCPPSAPLGERSWWAVFWWRSHQRNCPSSRWASRSSPCWTCNLNCCSSLHSDCCSSCFAPLMCSAYWQQMLWVTSPGLRKCCLEWNTLLPS